MARYMIVERFRNADPAPVYRRFRERGRLLPPGLAYVDSWVTADLSTCFQLMETDDAGLIDEWIGRWADIVEFEVRPLVTSEEASRRVPP